MPTDYELLFGSAHATRATEQQIAKPVNPHAPNWIVDIKSPSQLQDGKTIAQMVRQGVPSLWMQPDPRGGSYPPLPTVPRGEVSVLYGLGGAGKTMVALQMAWSIAGRTTLFGGLGEGWVPANPSDSSSRVLCLLGETSERAIGNRLCDLRDELKAKPDTLAEIESRLLLAPLSHRPHSSFVSWGKDQAYTLSEVAIDLFALLRGKEEEYSLIVVDPLVIFGGDDVERDPRAMQELAAYCRKLTQLKGNPSVIVLHHANKAAYQSESSSAANLRGTGAIINSVQCVMEFRVKKNKKEASKMSGLSDVGKAKYKSYRGRRNASKTNEKDSWADDDGVVHSVKVDYNYIKRLVVNEGHGESEVEEEKKLYELAVVKANEIKPWSVTLEQRSGRCYWLADT